MTSLLLLLALSATPAHAADASKKAVMPPPSTGTHAEADNEVVESRTCRKDKDERLLQVIPKERGCVLEYHKGGRAEEKAHSIRGVQVCQDTLKKIRERLEQSGFKCE